MICGPYTAQRPEVPHSWFRAFPQNQEFQFPNPILELSHRPEDFNALFLFHNFFTGQRISVPHSCIRAFPQPRNCKFPTHVLEHFHRPGNFSCPLRFQSFSAEARISVPHSYFKNFTQARNFKFCNDNFHLLYFVRNNATLRLPNRNRGLLAHLKCIGPERLIVASECFWDGLFSLLEV